MRDPDKPHQIIDAAIRVFARNGYYNSRVSDIAREAAAHEISAYFGVINDVLEEGAASGQIRRDVPVKIATKMLFGAMDQLATSWVLGKRAYRLTEAAEPVATIFLQGVCAHGV